MVLPAKGTLGICPTSLVGFPGVVTAQHAAPSPYIVSVHQGAEVHVREVQKGCGVCGGAVVTVLYLRKGRREAALYVRIEGKGIALYMEGQGAALYASG